MKNLLDFILEGAWGYEPDQNDGTLDLRGDIYLSICELIYNKCIQDKKKKKSNFSTDYAWEALGCIEYFFEALASIDDFGLHGKNTFDKYYYWWRLIDKKKKNIVDLYEELLNICKNDEKWITGWKEPDKMRTSLNQRELNLAKYKQLLNDRIEYEKSIEFQTQSTKQAEEIEEIE